MGATRRQMPNLQPAIDRLRAIVAQSGDHLLMGDGPPNPDAELLDLCSEALHHLTAAAAVYQSRPWFRYKHGSGKWTAEDEKHDQELMGQYYQHRGQACSRMTRAKKLRAVTAAGIYAKALCVRASRTGAAEFAMSLAEDLVNNHALRAMLWGAEAEPSPNVAQADNVVPLIPRSRGEGAP